MAIGDRVQPGEMKVCYRTTSRWVHMFDGNDTGALRDEIIEMDRRMRNAICRKRNIMTDGEAIRWCARQLQEIAEKLSITPQTVRAYIKQGRLRGNRVGRPILISEESLKEFLGIAKAASQSYIRPS